MMDRTPFSPEDQEAVYPDGSVKHECWNSTMPPVRTALIRHGCVPDAQALAELEAACFPPAEAAPLASFQHRLEAFPECFWILSEGGRIISCINGCASRDRDLSDEMYADASLHDPDGCWQMLFGVLTHPDFQHRGYASRLMRQVIRESRLRGRSGIVLTCKEQLIPFYSRFGFINEGVSSSDHGGARWFQMRLTL